MKFPPEPGSPMVPVTTEISAQAKWSPSGNQLFYMNDSHMIMAVDWSADNGEFNVTGPPRPVLQAKILGITATRNFYCITKEGDFLVLNNVEQPHPITIKILKDWPTIAQMAEN